MKYRLAKFISHSGYRSRRKAEELILSGRVLVNNEIIVDCAF
ncbi:MAG: S4 domain-containing protein [Candidatus Midichloria sp.]